MKTPFLLFNLKMLTLISAALILISSFGLISVKKLYVSMTIITPITAGLLMKPTLMIPLSVHAAVSSPLYWTRPEQYNFVSETDRIAIASSGTTLCAQVWHSTYEIYLNWSSKIRTALYSILWNYHFGMVVMTLLLFNFAVILISMFPMRLSISSYGLTLLLLLLFIVVGIFVLFYVTLKLLKGAPTIHVLQHCVQ